MRNVCAVLLLGLLSFGRLIGCGVAVRADDASLTEEALLEDLGAELLKPSTRKPTVPLDERLLKQWRLLEQAGEDVGERQPAKGVWLSRVVERMQTAQTLLELRDESGTASSAQAEALTRLDAMIAELIQRQCQCKGDQNSGGKSARPGQKKPSQPKPGNESGKKPGATGKAGKSPDQVAPSATQSGADLSTELAVAGELVKDLWGQLPQRQREQILQPLGEEFLPKYASEIEAYFRALADPSRIPSESQ